MLKVKFTRIKNVVLMEVLEQSGIPRGADLLYEEDIDDDDEYVSFSLHSCEHPYLQRYEIFVCGEDTEKDNIIASVSLDSETEARDYIKRAICLIHSFNKTIKGKGKKHEEFDLKDAEIFITCEKEE